MKKQLFIILIIILFGNNFQTSAARLLYKSKSDTNYYESHKKMLAIKFLGVSKVASFSIFDNQNSSKLLYQPNEALNIGLGFNYKWFGLDLAFNIPGFNNDNAKYGKTKKTDIQTHIYTRKIIIDANLQHYKGFYIKNPKDIINNWQSDQAYPQRSDIETVSIGCNLTYSFNNKKFSYKSAFIQNERQKKSAGSFLLGAFVSAFAIGADHDIIPYYSIKTFNENLHLVSASSFSLGISVGYIYTFVIRKNYFVTLSLVPGFALGGYSGTTVLNKTIFNPVKVDGKTLARVSIGYNSKKYYYGFLFVNDNYTSSNQEKNIGVNYGANIFKFYIGRKFSIKKR
ncbi:MAG: hypothetical protein DRJ01_15145 [Bacteroidetes bacterium]|nr:MAG: hypothetical protein DRJ01_15145 [Bacteroidota bacterium]